MGTRRRRLLLLLFAVAGLFALPSLPHAAAVFECPTVTVSEQDPESVYACASADASALTIVGTTDVAGVRTPLKCDLAMKATVAASDKRVRNTTVKHYVFDFEAGVACGAPPANRIEIYQNKLTGPRTFVGPYKECYGCAAPDPSAKEAMCSGATACKGTYTHSAGIRIYTNFAVITAAQGKGFTCSSTTTYIDCTGTGTIKA